MHMMDLEWFRIRPVYRVVSLRLNFIFDNNKICVCIEHWCENFVIQTQNNIYLC